MFAVAAAGHMSILQINGRRGHKFVISGLMFGYCMARITAMVMRIASIIYSTNVRVAIAANIFAVAGVLILYIVNLIFAQRLIRAAHPGLGWNKVFSWAFILLYIIVICMLVMVITGTVQSFYTLDTNIRQIDHDLQRTALAYITFIAFLPLPIVALIYLFPRKVAIDNFGKGKFTTKVGIVVFASVLLCLNASYRAVTNFEPTRPASDPAWFDTKAAWWCFDFVLEIIVIYFYLIVRVDQRFWVPNGSKAYGDYSKREIFHQDHISSSSADDIDTLHSQNRAETATKAHH
jgi:hypothetical protein